MKQISGKDFCRALERNGWGLRRVHGSHHIYCREGSVVRLSVPVHGHRPLKVGLVHHLLALSGLSEADL